MASRSASAPGDDDHCGGMGGSADASGYAPLDRRPPRPSTPDPGPCSSSIASPSRSIVSVTSGGTRSPVARSAAAASANWWLTLSTAIRWLSRRERPPA